MAIGDLIAIIENPANFEDVYSLKDELYNFDLALIDTTLGGELFEYDDVRFGTIQADYSSFQKAYKNFIDFERLDYHNRRIVLLRSEMDKHQILHESMAKRAYRRKEQGAFG